MKWIPMAGDARQAYNRIFSALGPIKVFDVGDLFAPYEDRIPACDPANCDAYKIGDFGSRNAKNFPTSLVLASKLRKNSAPLRR
jgi:hypothetical protein